MPQIPHRAVLLNNVERASLECVMKSYSRLCSVYMGCGAERGKMGALPYRKSLLSIFSAPFIYFSASLQANNEIFSIMLVGLYR